MSEFQRVKDALDVAMTHLRDYVLMDEHRACVDKVDAILNPVEYEEIEEIVGWVNVYQNSTGEVYAACLVHATEEQADENSGEDRISCQPIRVTVKREKKRPVERSVTVRAHIIDSPVWAAGGAEGPDCLTPFHAYPECHGKSGKLTFTYTEDPTT